MIFTFSVDLYLWFFTFCLPIFVIFWLFGEVDERLVRDPTLSLIRPRKIPPLAATTYARAAPTSTGSPPRNTAKGTDTGNPQREVTAGSAVLTRLLPLCLIIVNANRFCFWYDSFLCDSYLGVMGNLRFWIFIIFFLKNLRLNTTSIMLYMTLTSEAN